MTEDMTGIPTQPVGKISREVFARAIQPRLGAVRPEVLMGPRHGVDVGVIDVEEQQVVVVTTDPFYVVPEYGWDRAAWFAVHIVASDAATSGLAPRYCTVDLNLPLSMTDGDLSALWAAVHETCREIGVAVVTGHTGRYEGCQYPMLGAATMLSVGAKDSFVTPELAQAGDAVLVTKGAAIETTGVFGVAFPERLRRELGPDVAKAAAALFYQMSVVKDAAAAVSVGVRERGVTSMHDATERGIWGGLVEMAEASETGLVIERDAIPVRDEVRAVCDLYEIDPYSASSEGTLLLTCRPHKVAAVIARLGESGIEAQLIGEVTPADEGVRVVVQGRVQPLHAPLNDSFWPAYLRAREQLMV
jgi:hydrogenase maturation factor